MDLPQWTDWLRGLASKLNGSVLFDECRGLSEYGQNPTERTHNLRVLTDRIRP
jgi:hypothetical protein